MNLKTKSLLYNFIGFALIYIPVYFLISQFTSLSGLWRPATSAVISSIISPKFQTVQTQNGQKLFMSWLFIKGVREIK